jgi:hypothetical protein
MPDPALRFAAGSSERPNSGVWRLWTRGSDTYLAVRIAVHVFKLSMHKSGQWISAFTSQSGVVDPATGSRRHHTWTRPPEFTPGWVQGPAVVIPWVRWRGQFQPIGRPPPPPDTVWVPGPARKRKLVVNLLFAAATVPAGAINSVSQPGDWIVGSLPLSHGEMVWVQARQVGISPDERKGLASVDREYGGIQVSGDLSSMDWWGSGSPRAHKALRCWFSSRSVAITSGSSAMLLPRHSLRSTPGSRGL